MIHPGLEPDALMYPTDNDAKEATSQIATFKSREIYCRHTEPRTVAPGVAGFAEEVRCELAVSSDTRPQEQTLKLLKTVGVTVAIASIAALATGLLSVASAQQPATTYTAKLSPVPLNGADGATGTLTIALNGNQATITQQVSGLATTFMNAPYPHVQHIHGGANGVCPIASADTNSDGVLNTAEGQPSYGGILTTLSVSGDTTPAAGTNVQIAPTGGSYNYSRTITLDAATMASLTAGKAVIVVHGLNPATAAPAATSSPSELVPSLPLAATSPALCGTLVAAAAAPAPAPTTAAPVAPAPTATPVTGATMSPPSTGDGGLAGDNRSMWALTAAAIVAAVVLVGAGTFAAVKNHSR